MMNKLPLICISLIIISLWPPSSSAAQSFDTVGTRAKGMGGAQVAAVEDASAAYWNPGGFASGAYFSLVLDWSTISLNPPEGTVASRQDGIFFALGAPAFGLTYYQLESTALRVLPTLAPGASFDGNGTATLGVATVLTHNLGATVVQSLFPGVAVGTTLKYVKARSGLDVRLDGDRDAILGHGATLGDTSDREFDMDIGVMASGGGLKLGLTVRNVLEPKFNVGEAGSEVQLQRQVRAGIAVKPGNFTIAADFDLLEAAGPFGDVRDIALGAEARLGGRVFARGGFHVNTISLPEVGHTPAYGVGGSFALTSSLLIDGQVTVGSDKAPRGWGISGRFVY